MLRKWILGLIAGSILCSAASSLAGKGAGSRVVKLVGAAVLLTLLLSPILSPDGESYAFSMAEFYQKRLEVREGIELRQDYLSRVYIEQEYAAYILDEAQSLGMEGSVEVLTEWKGGCYVPTEVILTMRGGSGRERLSEWMEAELGIEKARQVWHDGA